MVNHQRESDKIHYKPQSRGEKRKNVSEAVSDSLSPCTFSSKYSRTNEKKEKGHSCVFRRNRTGGKINLISRAAFFGAYSTLTKMPRSQIPLSSSKLITTFPLP